MSGPGVVPLLSKALGVMHVGGRLSAFVLLTG